MGRFVHASASIYRGIPSRLTNSKRTFCKADRDAYTKRARLHTCGNSLRARLSLDLGPLSALACRRSRALPFFAFARTSSSRYALVRASRRRDNELLLSRKTTSLPLPSRIVHIHVTIITNHQQSTIISGF